MLDLAPPKRRQELSTWTATITCEKLSAAVASNNEGRNVSFADWPNANRNWPAFT
jgi:hypothetical protein